MNRALDSFEGLTGRPAAGSWLAPGRLNLIGEHTDYNGGFALPIALDRGVHVAIAPRADDVLNAHSLQRPDEPTAVSIKRLAPGALAGWAAYPAGVLWALREEGCRIGGVDLVVDSDIPLGAGLSSSAALTCAVALACADLFGLDLPSPTLASIARRAEQEFVGVPVGVLDQTASLRCRREHALLLDARDLSTEQIRLGLSDAGLALLVIDTQVPHQLRDGAYADRHRACSQAASSLGLPALRDLAADDLDGALERLDDPILQRRTRHVVTENGRVLEAASLLRAGEISAIGPLLSASHDSLRDDFEVSSPALDTAVEAALGAGAYGARMTGAGFGGSALALIAAGEASTVTSEVTKAFRRKGLATPQSSLSNPPLAQAGSRDEDAAPPSQTGTTLRPGTRSKSRGFVMPTPLGVDQHGGVDQDGHAPLGGPSSPVASARPTRGLSQRTSDGAVGGPGLDHPSRLRPPSPCTTPWLRRRASI